MSLIWQKCLCLLIGYAFGCILFADLFARIRGLNIYASGSGNPGMANSSRVLGRKTAVLVLLGDILKTLLAVLLCQYLFPDLGSISILYTGLGCTLGHDFPFWHRFDGGKGVTCICATIILYSPLWGILAGLSGLLLVLLKKGLKAAACTISIVFFAAMVFTAPIEAVLLSGILMILMIARNAVPNRIQPPAHPETVMSRTVTEEHHTPDADAQQQPVLSSPSAPENLPESHGH